jgi:hypothetical protein
MLLLECSTLEEAPLRVVKYMFYGGVSSNREAEQRHNLASLQHLDSQPSRTVEHVSTSTCTCPTRKQRPDTDSKTTRMAEELRTQRIGNVRTGPGGQTFVGTAGRDVVFSSPVDPKGKLYVAVLSQTRADLKAPCSCSGQSNCRLP